MSSRSPFHKDSISTLVNHTPNMHVHVIHNAYSPKETVELCSRAGVAKANMRIDKIFVSSFMAGCLLAFACAASLSTNSSPWFQTYAPGLIRMIAAIIFPFGLVSIVLTGADLCTGSFMFTTISALHRRLSPLKMLLHWVVTFFGNLAGSLFVMAIVIGYGGVFKTGAYHTEAQAFATTKAITPSWAEILVRGIGANWLVCLACFLSLMAREYFSKVMAIWWPTFAFVCLGLDHVVANMFFIPIGIWEGTPGLTVGYYIWKSMIPALIGNIIGGGVFVGVVYWYLYISGDTTPIPIDGDFYAQGQSYEQSVEHIHGASPGNGSLAHEQPLGSSERKSAENMV